MQAYTTFAKLYDKMMDNIPYEDWEQYLLCLFYKYGVNPEATVAELGSGTGAMTELLADDGFHMTGLDLSEDMLRIAKEKQLPALSTADSSAKDQLALGLIPEDQEHLPATAIHYMQADMRDFTLSEKQDAIISICDSVNYLTSDQDLYNTFASVRKNLKKGGVFIFDLKTRYFYQTVLDGQEYKYRGHNYKCTWKNHFDPIESTHHYLLDMQIKESGKWSATQEEHQQHVFTAKEIVAAAKLAGCTSAAAFDAFTFAKPKKHSERIYIVLKTQ